MSLSNQAEQTASTKKVDLHDDLQDHMHEEDEEIAQTKTGCGILGRYPIAFILLFAVTGMAVGIGVSLWTPETEEGMNTKDTVVQWLGLIGDLFIRCLKCIVLPLVFVNVMIAVVQMVQIGKASNIGAYTIGIYLTTTLVAALIGIVMTAIFKRFFTQGEFGTPELTEVTLACTEPGYLLSEMPDGNIECSDSDFDDSIASDKLTSHGKPKRKFYSILRLLVMAKYLARRAAGEIGDGHCFNTR